MRNHPFHNAADTVTLGIYAMNVPRITIIIPNLDQAHYLERAICSVLDQGYENLELIVMDGGSQDNSVEIIRCYADHIDHWQSCWDSGPAEAINTALSWATGDLVGVLDADDFYHPFALHEVAKAIGSRDWILGQAVRVDEDDLVLGDLPAVASNSLSALLMHDGSPTPGSATFYRTELVRAMGGFDSQMKLAYAHEMAVRLMAANLKPAVTKKLIASVREHDESLSNKQSLTCGAEFVEAAERYAEHLAPAQRYLLWRSCDEKRRIYAMAEFEVAEDAERRPLWRQLLRRAWWLASDDYRKRLLHGVTPANRNVLDMQDGQRDVA